MNTPAARISSFTSRCELTKECGSSGWSPSSPSSFTKPPIGQPVEACRRFPAPAPAPRPGSAPGDPDRRRHRPGAAPDAGRRARCPGRGAADTQDAGARREPHPELQHADPRQAGDDEVPELVEQDDPAQDDDEQQDRDDRVDDDAHAAPPTGPAVEGGSDLAVQLDERGHVGRLIRTLAEAPDGSLEQARDAREVERPAQEPGDRHLVGGDQGGRRPRSDAARLAGDPQRREPPLVRRAEVQTARARPGPAGSSGTAGDRGRSGRTGWGGACPGCPAGP